MITTLFRIAWRNLGRNRRRTGLTLAAIAVAQLAVLAADGFVNGYVDAMVDTLAGPMLGHVQVHAPRWRDERAMDLVVEDAEAVLSTVRAHPGVIRASGRIYAPALAAKGQDGHMVVVLGLESKREAEDNGLLAHVPAELLPKQQDVLVGSGLARKEGLEVGDELAIIGQAADGSMANDLVTIVGLLSSNVDLVNRSAVVMELSAAQEMFVMPDQVHEIVAYGHGAGQASSLARSLRTEPALELLDVADWGQIVPQFVSMLEMTEVSTLILVLLVFLTAAVGVANTMLMSTYERQRELGMLLALGTVPGRIVAIIAIEAVLLGVIGVLLGTLAGYGLFLTVPAEGLDMSRLAGESMSDLAYEGLNYAVVIFPRIAPRTVAAGFAAVLATSLLASLWPAVVAARLQPAEAMRS